MFNRPSDYVEQIRPSLRSIFKLEQAVFSCWPSESRLARYTSFVPKDAHNAVLQFNVT